MNDAFYVNNQRGFIEIGRRMPPSNKDLYPNANQPGYHHLGDHLGSSVVL